jgi:hypothetical protein
VTARDVVILLAMLLHGRLCLADIAAGPAVPLSDEELERAHAVIGRVYIDNQNIFDLRDPAENKRLFRIADGLHIKTRGDVIENQLLFRPGDAYSRRVLEESARILRSARYVYDATIEPVSFHDGVVDVRVVTRDVWTLNPGVSFGRKGGRNSSGVELEELNLLGTGVSLSASHQSGVDRNENALEVRDAHLLGSWTGVHARYSNNSDGQARELSIGQPFYALDTRRGYGLDVLDDQRVESLYDRGDIVDQFGVHRRFLESHFGFSRGLEHGWAKRWKLGVTYDDRRFAAAPEWTGASLLPDDRRLVYPWVQLDLVQDDYLTFMNHDQIGRTEDFHLGAQVSTRLGWASSAFGSDRSALVFATKTSRGFELGGGSTVLFSAGLDGRWEQGALHNAAVDGAIRYYVQQSEHRLFFTTLEVTAGNKLDIDNPVVLGGESGLRGYPLRYQSGASRALLTVEQRYFTNWYPFQLFRVGGAAFFDMGRTWGPAPLAEPNLGVLKDVGLGLRFGNSRSGLGNIIHVDVAFPLDGESSLKSMQFLVETRERF